MSRRQAPPPSRPERPPTPARPPRSQPRAKRTLIRAAALTRLAVAGLVLTGIALAGPALAGPALAGPAVRSGAVPAAPAPALGAGRASTAAPVGSAELERVTGGICTTCSTDTSGGGGGGNGSSGTPTATGTPYWETYQVALGSTSTTPASMVSKINNYSDRTINGTFTYTRKVVRSVQFSGGYANFIRASIGGEVSQSTQTSVTYPIEPRTFGKLYVRYRTERRTYYGRRYQDYTDGSRTVVGRDSGPYQSTSTVLGYVTGAL